MSDLELEKGNKAAKVTSLSAIPDFIDTDHLADFTGNHILVILPDTTLSPGRDLGGIFARGKGTGVGVHGESNSGHGVRGEGQIGVFGASSATGFAAVGGVHSGKGFGVVGDGAGPDTAGVLGRNSTNHGVRGEGQIGVFGTSSTPGFAATAGQHTAAGGFGVVGDAAGGQGTAGVLGRNGADGHGVRGEGEIGVFGTSSTPGFAATAGQHTAAGGFGVVGDAVGGQGTAGVLGRNGADGHGVRGEGEIGVFGISSTPGFAAVAGMNTGAGGFGVVGDATGPDTAGVLGRNSTGHGVRGEGGPGVVGICTQTGAEAGEPSGGFAGVRGRSTSGPGVFGVGNYGGQFKGASAQLSLVPGTQAGRPTTGHHNIGEIYMDSAATLFVCVASGDPGTWVKVVTAAA